MTGTDLAAAGRRAGHGPTRPVTPGDWWSPLRHQPHRRRQAPPRGDSQLGLSIALKRRELPAIAVAEVDQLWGASAPVGRGGGTS
jgi:hypothetical protein